jgi:tetratricopeptide (TPR) repeat protein
MIARMHDRTGGVPLFIEEFTRLVQVSGELPREIPGTLQDLVMARLELMTGERDLVQLASVLGREFSYELLAAVAGLDEATLQAELLKLMEAELLYPKGRPPKCSYLFKHALLQDAAYASLVKVKRQDHHRRVADVLESRFPLVIEAQPELLAHHLTEAGVVDRATDAWFKAGMKSLARWAHAEAIGHFQRGLTLLRGLEESLERDGQEMKFLKPLGMATMAASGYASPEAGAVMTRARELSERIGHPVQLFAVMWGVWAWHVVRAEYPLCMKLWDEALTFSGKLGDPGIRMEALFMPALTLFSRGDFPGAFTHLTDALTHYDDRSRTRHWADITGQDSGIAHRCYHALSLWHLGCPDQAQKAMREAIDLAGKVDHPYSLAYVHHHAAWFYYNLRMPDEAMAAAVEEARLAADHGFELLIATSMMYKAAALLLRGPSEAALPLLRDGIARYRASGAEMALPFYYSILARATLGLGRFKETRAALAEAFGMVEKNDDRFRESDLHHLQAELALAESRDEAQAEPHLLKAREVARRQGSRALELKCTLSLARLWKGQGRANDALETLKSVYSRYTEGFATSDLADAARMIADLEKDGATRAT